MAVWADKATGDVVEAAHPNQLADGIDDNNDYNFGTDTTLDALADKHVSATGAHTAGDGIAITGTPESFAVDLHATPGLQFIGGDLAIKEDTVGTQVLERHANGLRFHSSAAGAGLGGGGGVALSVNVDDATIEIPVDTLQVKNAGITAAKLAAAVAGAGLTGGAGSALAVGAGDGMAVAADAVAVDLVAVNPGLEFVGGDLQVDADDSTIERAAGGIQVKDAGITGTQLNTSVAGDGLTGGGGAVLAVGAGDGIAAAANAVAVDLAGGDDGLEISLGKLTATAATEGVKGVVELALENAESTAALACQASDDRLVQKLIWSDSQVGGASGSSAAAWTEYGYTDPGANGAELKIRTVFPLKLDYGVTSVKVVCVAQVTADPAPQTAYVRAETGSVLALPTNNATAETQITSYGSYAAVTVTIDVSGLSSLTTQELQVSLKWTSAAASGQTAKMKAVHIYTCK